MKRTVLFAATFSSLIAAAASAAHVDMNDPRRALGREDNIRVDAQILQDTLSDNSPLSVTYQIENLSTQTIGVADRVGEVSYDSDTGTVTFSIGAEVPAGTTLPHMVTIGPGQKRVLTTGCTVHIAVPHFSEHFGVPRFVQIKVNVLKDVTPFAALLDQQAKSSQPPALPGDLFDKWVDANDSVFLNTVPVRWNSRNESLADASQRRAN